MKSVVIKVGPTVLAVSPRLDFETANLVKQSLKYRVLGYQFTRAHIDNGWDGWKYPFNMRQLAPSGLYWRVKTILQENDYDVKIEFLHSYPCLGDNGCLNGIELKAFQKRAVEKAIKKKFGIISAPVRAGKTAIMSSIIKKLQQYPTFVVTKDCDLVLQTVKDISDHTGLKVGSYSNGKWTEGDIIVTHYGALASVVSLAFPKKKRKVPVSKDTREKCENIIRRMRETKVLLLDECHLAYAPATRGALEQFCKTGYRIGVSGTPFSDAVPVKETESVLGPVIFKVLFSTLIKSNRIAQPVVYVYTLPHKWYTETSPDYAYVYETNIVNNTFRNRFIARIAEELRKKNKTCFIMVQKLEHGKQLRSMIPGSFFVHGDIDPNTRLNVYSALQNKTIHCIIGTVGKVGLNIPRLDAVVNAEGLKSHISTIQRMRSLTAADGKTHGLIIDFIDQKRYLCKHSSRRYDKYCGIAGFVVKLKKIEEDFFEVNNVQ